MCRGMTSWPVCLLMQALSLTSLMHMQSPISSFLQAQQVSHIHPLSNRNLVPSTYTIFPHLRSKHLYTRSSKIQQIAGFLSASCICFRGHGCHSAITRVSECCQPGSAQLFIAPCLLHLHVCKHMYDWCHRRAKGNSLDTCDAHSVRGGCMGAAGHPSW